jgi:acetamidase/formamidase
LTARVRLRFTVEKGTAAPWPRIVSPTQLMSVGSARPLEDAARIAYHDLLTWLEADYGWDRWEAYQLLTQAGRVRLGNMVDPQYSVVAKIDRELAQAPGSAR